MALDSKNNIKSVFIVPSGAAIVTTGVKVTPGSIGAGKVVVTNMSNEILDSSNTVDIGVKTYEKIKIVKDRGANNPLQQLVLTLPSITTFTGVSGAPATEQVSYIGYDGVNSNTIQVASNNFYTVKLEHTPNSFAYGKRPANYKYGTFQSPEFASGSVASVNAAIIANGLVGSLIQNFRPNRTTDWRVFAAVTVSGTRVAAGTGTLTFTKYSKVVVGSIPGAVSGIIVGDYIQAAPGANATDGSVGVYKVAGKSGNNLILENAFNGEFTVAAATGLIKVPKATAEGVNALIGIKITGIKQKYDVNRWRQYDKVRFNTFIEGFPNTTTPTLVTTTAAFDGIAVYEQVANDEYISWGDEGQVFVDQVPPLFREQDAIDVQYTPLVIGWLDRLPSLIGAGENKGQLITYFQDVANGQGSNLLSIISAWLLAKFPNGSGL